LLRFNCVKPGCDFEIDDGEHVDDVLQKLHEHFRAQHPRSYFEVRDTGFQIQQYNQTLDEFFVTQYGERWADNPAQVLVRNLRGSVLSQRNVRYYGPELREEARIYVEAAGVPADPQDANADLGQADFPAGGRIQWNAIDPGGF